MIGSSFRMKEKTVEDPAGGRRVCLARCHPDSGIGFKP